MRWNPPWNDPQSQRHQHEYFHWRGSEMSQRRRQCCKQICMLLSHSRQFFRSQKQNWWVRGARRCIHSRKNLIRTKWRSSSRRNTLINDLPKRSTILIPTLLTIRRRKRRSRKNQSAPKQRSRVQAKVMKKRKRRKNHLKRKISTRRKRRSRGEGWVLHLRVQELKHSRNQPHRKLSRSQFKTSNQSRNRQRSHNQ